MIDDKDGSERSGAAGALDAISDLEGGLRRWACAARAQGTAGGNDPADCNWPVCGCDPAADRVIAALQESGAIPDGGLTAAAHDVLAERRRQVDVEGWTIDHDDKHANGEMASAAACYVTAPAHLGQGTSSDEMFLAHALIAATSPGAQFRAGMEAALEVAGRAAWKHEGNDAYSQGMDRGAWEQVKACVAAIRAAIAALPALTTEEQHG